MESSAVDSFLPKAVPSLPFQLLAPQANTPRPAGNQASFERYLQAARDTSDSRRTVRQDDRKAQPHEQATRPAEPGKPADAGEQVRTRKNGSTKDDKKADDSGSDQARAADDDPAVKAAAAAVALKAATAEAVELTAAGDAAAQPLAADVQVVETDAPADEGAADGVQADAEGEEAGFTAELAEAEATELRERAAVQPATEQIEQIDEAGGDSASQPPDVAADAGDELAELDDSETEVSVKREPAEPVNPAPPAPTPSDPTAFAAVALRPGEQIRATARPATGPTGIAQPAASRAPAADAPVFDQVVRGASLMIAQGRSEIRVQLRPPELGTVRLHLVSDRNNVVDARIVTERDDVRQLVERNLPELRDALAGSGIDVGSFDVSTQHSGQAWDDSPGSSARRNAWDATESEGELPLSEPSDSVRGVNRSSSADAIDYII